MYLQKAKFDLFLEITRAYHDALITPDTKCEISATRLERMQDCTSNWGVRHGVVSGNRQTSHVRCKDSQCPACSDERRSNIAAEIRRRVAVADISPRSILVAAVFKSEPFQLASASLCVAQCMKQWQDFTAPKLFRSAVSVVIARTFALDISLETDTVRSLTNALLCVDRPERFRDEASWLAHWNAQRPAHPASYAYFRQGPLNDDTLVDDMAQRIALVGVTPRQLCRETTSGLVSDARTLLTTREAIHGRRMVAYARGKPT